ncbi:integral membrane protein CcmA involved in cell shape determination [Candidatus Vecturithrix granuli]|uniref:Integral membrane protein CcmA involved in cell shape determination n=1 Tax=Vecturithrix granuli TaxID=1499967 RepID=A0A081C3M4_VECG1|nr:integral membrane protein CcmA involved in cell shape determination [Candidatus Vecturithrix granuli]
MLLLSVKQWVKNDYSLCYALRVDSMRQTQIQASPGVVLFMVLILTVMMFLAAGTLLIITMTEIRLSDFEYRSNQAFYGAESAIALGIANLRQESAAYGPIAYEVGGNPGYLEISTRFLPPSVYHFILCGAARISGWQASATRAIEREITIKPFVVFAENQVTLTGQCTIEGNVHGHATIEVGPSVTITGNVTASTTPVLNQGTIEGDHISSDIGTLEPEISFPELAIDFYSWTYPCTGIDGAPIFCEAQPLIHDTLLLDLDENPETPEETIELFSSDVSSTNNPARIFYLSFEVPEASLTAFNVYGTVVIPSDYPSDTVLLKGSFMIEPLNTSSNHFPALISAKPLSMTFREDLANKSDSIAENHITGLIYVLGDLTLISETSGEIITGSLFGRNITITGNQAAATEISYDPAIFTTPPPGFDLIELGAWRESVFE